MNSEVLIDAVVRQTTVLLAQLATSTGTRAPLAHTANQVFLDLVRELRAQGMTNAVIADMFGMALRTYHKRLRRLSESATFRGQSLWTAVLRHLQESGPQLRAQLFHRFRNDDEVTLRGVLTDMVEGGILYSSGQNDATVYRALDPAELPSAWTDDPERLTHLVWVSVYRFGPLEFEAIRNVVPAPEEAVASALERLQADGRVRRDRTDGVETYGCDRCFIPVGSSAGWEASVFDHYQAVVTTICNKLRLRSNGIQATDVGGSTYRFSVWAGHPHYDAVMSLYSRMRTDAAALRAEVESYNAAHDAPAGVAYESIVTYLGQTRLASDSETPHDHSGNEHKAKTKESL